MTAILAGGGFKQPATVRSEQDEPPAKSTTTPAGMKPGLAARHSTSFSVAKGLSGTVTASPRAALGRSRTQIDTHDMQEQSKEEQTYGSRGASA